MTAPGEVTRVVTDAPPKRSHVDVMFGVGLFVIAFAARWIAARTLAAEPVWDGQYYDFGAHRIAAGLGYSDERVVGGHTTWHPWCHYPVGYSAYLSVFYKLFGEDTFAPQLANALAGALLALVTFLLAREALSPTRARIAGTIVALHPGLVLYGALVMTEPLASLLTLAAFYVALRMGRLRDESMGHPRSPRTLDRLVRAPFTASVAGAFILGLGALVRPQALLCAPFLAIASPRTSWRRRVALAAVSSAVALAAVAPWSVRNCRVMDACALVSTNGGWNLAIGAFPRATGRFETLRSSDGCREVTGQVQQDRCWFAYGIANIRREPGRWLSLIPKKLAYTFDHESFAVEYLHEARPEAWPEPRRRQIRELTTLIHRLLVAFAPLGFLALPSLCSRSPSQRSDHLATGLQLTLVLATLASAYLAFSADNPAFWPLVLATCVLPWLPLPGRPPLRPALVLGLGLLVTTVVTHAVFFGEDRYHVVVTPVLALFVAGALRPSREALRVAHDIPAEHEGPASSRPERTPFAA